MRKLSIVAMAVCVFMLAASSAFATVIDTSDVTSATAAASSDLLSLSPVLLAYLIGLLGAGMVVGLALWAIRLGVRKFRGAVK